jgi:hypothetical protein
LLDDHELSKSLAKARTVFAISLSKFRGEFLEIVVRLLVDEVGLQLLEYHLEETIAVWHKYRPQDVKCLHDPIRSLLELAKVQGPIAFKEEVVEHPFRFQETSSDCKGLEVGNRKHVGNASLEDLNFGDDTVNVGIAK